MACRACGFDHSPLIRCEVAAATNRIATNVDATNKTAAKISPDDASDANGIVGAQSDSDDGSSAGIGKTKNRRSREAYNRYQRDYMRARRARVPS